MVSQDMVANAVCKLGEADNLDIAARRRADPQPWGFCADGGRGYNLGVLSVWDHREDKPVVAPAACADLMHDGSAVNSANTLTAAFTREGLAPTLCCNGLSDGAPAAQNEIDLALEQQRAACGVTPPCESDSPTCAIDGWALEERHTLERVMPDGYLIDALRLVWECVKAPDTNKIDDLRKWWVEEAKLQRERFDETLGKTPEFSMSKWAITADGVLKLLQLLDTPHNNRVPYKLSMMERFLEVAVSMTAGSTATGAVRIKHPLTDKLLILSGIFAALDVTAGMYLLADVWEQCYSEFYARLKKNSRFGDFADGQLRHEMAVNVCHVTAYCTTTRRGPTRRPTSRDSTRSSTSRACATTQSR